MNLLYVLVDDLRPSEEELRRLAPDRPPVAIQLWTFRRVVVTLAVLAMSGLSGLLLLASVRAAGLL